MEDKELLEMQTESNKKGKIVYCILMILFIVAGVVLGYYLGNTGVLENENDEKTKTTTAANTTVSTTTEVSGESDSTVVYFDNFWDPSQEKIESGSVIIDGGEYKITVGADKKVYIYHLKGVITSDVIDDEETSIVRIVSIGKYFLVEMSHTDGSLAAVVVDHLGHVTRPIQFYYNKLARINGNIVSLTDYDGRTGAYLSNAVEEDDVVLTRYTYEVTDEFKLKDKKDVTLMEANCPLKEDKYMCNEVD